MLKLGPHNDIFGTFLGPTLQNDVGSFVERHYHCALLSKQPLVSLRSRFLVTAIGLNKIGMPSQHESFAVWVLDKETGETHECTIERVPSDRSFHTRFGAFSRFIPSLASDSVLESLQKAIRVMKSIPVEAADSMLAAITMETESIRLLPLTHHDCDSFTSMEASSPPDDIETSLIDTVTSTLAQVVATARNASDSISPRKLANDTITGCASQTLDPENCIHLFKPVDLPLFDVALLAEAVHDYAPVYGLFDNQCYLFASVLFDAIVQLYSLPASAQDPNIPSSSTPIPAPTSDRHG